MGETWGVLAVVLVSVPIVDILAQVVKSPDGLVVHLRDRRVRHQPFAESISFSVSDDAVLVVGNVWSTNVYVGIDGFMRKGDLLASSSKVDAPHCRGDVQSSASEAA